MKSLYGVAKLPCHQTRQCNMFDFTLLTFLLLKKLHYKKAYYLVESERYEGIMRNKCLIGNQTLRKLLANTQNMV